MGDYSADVLPPSRSSGLDLPLGRALGLPAAYRAVQITGWMGSQLTMYAERNGQRLDQPGFIDQPDPWRSQGSFVERLLVGMATDGNAFIRKYRTGTVVNAVEALDPKTTVVRWEKIGGRWHKRYDAWTRDGYVTLTADEVEHVWLLEVPGRDRGLGPIEACRLALSGILDVKEYAANWFQEPDVPTGTLTTDQRLDPALAREYRDMWINPNKDLPEEDQRKRARLGPGVRVLGSGLSYQAQTLNPEDAQWLEAQGAGARDVAVMFGMPGDYLMAAIEGSTLTYNTLESLDTRYLRTTLFPGYLRKIADAMTSCLPRGQVARFDTGALLLPDAETRAKIDQIYLPLGVDTPENVANRENRPVGKAAAPAPVVPAQPVVPVQ